MNLNPAISPEHEILKNPRVCDDSIRHGVLNFAGIWNSSEK